MTVATYCRVSSSNGSQDTENQAVQLRKYAAKQGWQIVDEYVDHMSGKTGDRPEFQRMLYDANQRKWELLLFWSLDRLSREGVLETLGYLQRLSKSGVEWKSYTEQYLDSCGVFKDAVLSILATVAKQERIRISERVKAGIANARAKGTALGRPPIIFDRDKLLALHDSGMSWRRAAATLGISPSLAYKAGSTMLDREEL